MDYELLHEVALIDKELIKLEREKVNKDTVKELNFLKKEHGRLKAIYEKSLVKQTELTGKTKQVTKILDDKTKEKTDAEEGLYSTSSLKTIETFERLIEKLNSEIKSLEEEAYVTMSSNDTLMNENHKSVENINVVMSKYNELLKKYKKEQSISEEKITLLNKERSALMDKISKEAAGCYEESKTGNGFGMSEVKGQMCSGCNVDIPVGIINDVKYSKKLLKCPNCNRLLYIMAD